MTEPSPPGPGDRPGARGADAPAAGGIRERVAAAFAAVPRTAHLPPSQLRYAALDRALPIGHDQTNSQPSTVRAMLEALDPRPGHRVLDIGSGSGWTTVLLARLVGPTGSVLGLERLPELVAFGRERLARAHVPWARIEPADPRVLGAPAAGPFDRILVSAMARRIPQQLVGQLRPTGVLVVPAEGQLWRVTADGARHSLGRYVFVPLVPDE